MNLFIALIAMSFLSITHAEDLGFRFTSIRGTNMNLGCTKCIDGGQACPTSMAYRIKGMNPDFLGECGDLTGASLKNAVIESTLTGADFTDADLSGAIIKSSTADQTNFLNADMQNASFSDSTAYDDFYDSIWAGADLRGANLVHAQFVMTNHSFGAIIDSKTVLPATYSDYTARSVFNVDMMGSFVLDESLDNSKCNLIKCGMKHPIFATKTLEIKKIIAKFNDLDLIFSSSQKSWKFFPDSYDRDEYKKFLPSDVQDFYFLNMNTHNGGLLLFKDGNKVKLKVVQIEGQNTFIRNYYLKTPYKYERSHEDRSIFMAK